MITEEQRKKMHQVRVEQAIRKLNEISDRQNGLINGNFTAVAHKYGLKVKELRAAYDQSRASNRPFPFPRNRRDRRTI
jgi:uncharacterized protein YbbC (DUF1343 family)